MSLQDDGSFYFDSEDILCTGKTRLTEFISNYLGDSDNYSIELKNDNELVPLKTKLATPIYLYSKKRLEYNFLNYKYSFENQITNKFGIQTCISYSVKANFNPSILKLFHQFECWASLVNKNELLLAKKIGLKGENLIFNGNGKKMSEIELAIKSNCYLNIDSLFNLIHTIKIAEKIKENCDLSLKEKLFPVKLLIRINQTTNAQVHQYLNTSGEACKFGIQENQVDNLIELVKQNKELVKLSGFHSHLGSTIKALDIYHESVKNLINLVNQVTEKYDLNSIEIINFGGGLGINYEKFANRTSTNQRPEIKIPTPNDLALVISQYINELKNKNIKIVVEPGRSLVGDSCILITNIIGFKKSANKNFLVIDGSMCECIRPCLYSAYHHIDYIKPLKEDSKRVLADIVGPVCESGDFLGKDRLLTVPSESDEIQSKYLAIMDVGAYCSSMSLNYNLHPKPAEIFIEEYVDEENINKSKYILTRMPDTIDNILASFIDYNKI